MEERKNRKQQMGHEQSAVAHFQDLRVYQEGFAAAMEIFHLSKSWPQEERYALVDQVWRSSRSVCANIAEAWKKRRYVAHFVSKLSDADTELGETQTWLQFALQCEYLAAADYDRLLRQYQIIDGGLIKMMVQPEKWCGSASLVREDTGVYQVEVE